MMARERGAHTHTRTLLPPLITTKLTTSPLTTFVVSRGDAPPIKIPGSASDVMNLRHKHTEKEGMNMMGTETRCPPHRILCHVLHFKMLIQSVQDGLRLVSTGRVRPDVHASVGVNGRGGANRPDVQGLILGQALDTVACVLVRGVNAALDVGRRQVRVRQTHHELVVDRVEGRGGEHVGDSGVPQVGQRRYIVHRIGGVLAPLPHTAIGLRRGVLAPPHELQRHVRHGVAGDVELPHSPRPGLYEHGAAVAGHGQGGLERVVGDGEVHGQLRHHGEVNRQQCHNAWAKRHEDHAQERRHRAVDKSDGGVDGVGDGAIHRRGRYMGDDDAQVYIKGVKNATSVRIGHQARCGGVQHTVRVLGV